MSLEFPIICAFVLAMLFVGCSAAPENTPLPPGPSPTPPSELPGQCSITGAAYELRRDAPPIETEFPYNGIVSPLGNWRAQTFPTLLLLTKIDDATTVSFPLPADGGTRAEEQLLWSPDERWLTLEYRFSLAKGGTQFFRGVYGINGAAYETLAVTATSLPARWTNDGLLFVRQPQPHRFTLILWNQNALTTLADDLTLPPFYAPDGSHIALYDGNSVDLFNPAEASRSLWVENIGRLETVIWSPDGNAAALKVARDEGESLLLAFVGGRSTITLRDGLSGLGDPLWSPDSSMLAFTQSVSSLPVELEVAAIDGSSIWTFSSFPLAWTLHWYPCD
ncbi:MAG: hypothetical protein U0694_28345 [Anaerolineae bacterium]